MTLLYHWLVQHCMTCLRKNHGLQLSDAFLCTLLQSNAPQLLALHICTVYNKATCLSSTHCVPLCCVLRECTSAFRTACLCAMHQSNTLCASITECAKVRAAERQVLSASTSKVEVNCDNSVYTIICIRILPAGAQVRQSLIPLPPVLASA